MGAGHNNQVGVYDNKRGLSEEQKTMIIIIGDDEGVAWSSSSSFSLSNGSFSSSSDPSSEEVNSFSNGSSSSSELLDDDASSSPSSSSTTPRSRRRGGGGALNDLSSLTTHLPIKRGLSRFYDGKSQSFTSLEIVESIGDLAKKGNPCNNRKLKYCKSYAGGLNNYYYKPKATISKRSSSSLSFLSRRPSFNSCRPPLCPFTSQVETNF